MKTKQSTNPQRQKLSTQRPAGFWAAAVLMEGRRQWFVSLEGRLWTPVAVDPRSYTRQDVDDALAPDANGFKSLECGIRFFVSQGLPIRIFPPAEHAKEAIRDLA